MNLAVWLQRTARQAPERPALGLGLDVVRDYGELARRVACLAGALTGRLGLRAGDRVAIAAKNCPDYAEVLLAIWHAGCAAVPINAKLHGAELAYALDHSGARACFVTADIETALESHAPAGLERLIRIDGPAFADLLSADPIPPARREPADLAWLFYTSGTTGRPKGRC